jgi:3-dehydroquinate synthase
MTELLNLGCSRDTSLVALGGGVIGDITGFVASTYQRGIPFVQVPTTLLSQVDSSVGGKTAVNHPLGKNMIGAFYQPKAVIIDLECLGSLPKRELSAGLAEVVKYGLLADCDFYQYLISNVDKINALDESVMIHIIAHCCQIKADIVAEDEKESGKRALLNLGHTFGHAIEAELGYGQWLHGEAVGAGMVQAAEVSKNRGWITELEVTQLVKLLEQFTLPTSGPESMSFDDYLKHMKKDKKVLSDNLRFVLLERIGQAILVGNVSNQELSAVL